MSEVILARMLTMTVQVFTLLTVWMPCAAFLLSLTPISAHAASPKSLSVIEADVLTVGDVFHDAERNADYVLGPAPLPGEDMILGVKTLTRIARAMDVSWQPGSGDERVIIRRAATLVSHEQIKQAVIHALKEEGADGPISVRFDAADAVMVLPQNYTAAVEISNLNYNAGTGLFEAVAYAPSKANPVRQMLVSGGVVNMIKVPMLNRAVQNGSVITNDDIQWTALNERDVQSDTVLDPDRLVGMTARRTILPDRPVRGNELATAKLVERGETVTVIYKNGPLNLSTEGRALQDGGSGQVIRVVNNNSSMPFDARVTGARAVTVQ